METVLYFLVGALGFLCLLAFVVIRDSEIAEIIKNPNLDRGWFDL